MRKRCWFTLLSNQHTLFVLRRAPDRYNENLKWSCLLIISISSFGDNWNCWPLATIFMTSLTKFKLLYQSTSHNSVSQLLFDLFDCYRCFNLYGIFVFRMSRSRGYRVKGLITCTLTVTLCNVQPHFVHLAWIWMPPAKLRSIATFSWLASISRFDNHDSLMVFLSPMVKYFRIRWSHRIFS